MAIVSKLNCPKCNGQGRICTFSGYINSSEDVYEKCAFCGGTKYFEIYVEHLPEWQQMIKQHEAVVKYLNNKNQALTDDIYALCGKIQEQRTKIEELQNA